MWLFTPPRRHDEFRGISLCAGVGGLDLGLHLAEPGYRAVCYVERNSFAASVLVARMADASLAAAPIWDDLKSFDGRQWRGKVHIVTAGYPCQPFTFSGQRKGAEDPRHLWPDVARIIDEVRPEWCFFENVPGHLSLGFQDVCRDLQGMGYRVAASVVSAAETGASHIRERMFILAHTNLSDGRQSDIDPDGAGGLQTTRRREHQRHPNCIATSDDRLVEPVVDHEGDGMDTRATRLFPPMPGDFVSWDRILEGPSPVPTEPILHRLDDGLAHGVDRYGAAGNGVVPMAAARAWRWLKEVHQSV